MKQNHSMFFAMKAMVLIVIRFLIFDVFVSKGVIAGSARLIFKDSNYKDCHIGTSECNFADIHKWFLKNHNSIRSTGTAGQSATNMLMMEWDQKLTDAAQSYAEECLPVSCLPERANFSGEVNTDIREHPYQSAASLSERIRKVLKYWKEEVDDYDSDMLTNQIRSYKIVSRDMQRWANVVRATTWKVGCGIVDIYSGKENPFNEIIVCFYKNAKLKEGEELYKIGKPCTECPQGTSCSEYLKTLCEVNPGKCPITSNERTIEESCSTKGNTVWRCSVEQGTEDCLAERACSSFWEIDVIGKFKKISVSGMCSSVNIFHKEIQIDEPACFIFEYIKEPTLSQAVKSEVTGFILQSNGQYSEKVTASDDAKEWTPIKVDIPWTGIAVQVGVGVRSRSPPTAGKQDIKVRNFSVVTGKCT
uniref:Putative CAP peptide n=1 Tax=Superstitionia donensis TaxID=311983 RepID=A0A1V1WB29_9SCOR